MMLYIFVEGPDDEIFFSSIMVDQIKMCHFIQYIGLTTVKINNFIHSINCTDNCDYIFLGDADGKQICECKAALLRKYSNLNEEKTYAVQYEIESWYYAGVQESYCRHLKLRHFTYRTDDLTKEQFNAKLLRIADRKYVMAQMLAAYDSTLAINRNNSFSIFKENIKLRTCLSCLTRNRLQQTIT